MTSLKIEITGTTFVAFILGCCLSAGVAYATLQRSKAQEPDLTLHDYAVKELVSGNYNIVKALLPPVERAGLSVVKDCRLLDSIPRKKGKAGIPIAERLEKGKGAVYRIICQRMSTK